MKSHLPPILRFLPLFLLFLLSGCATVSAPKATQSETLRVENGTKTETGYDAIVANKPSAKPTIQTTEPIDSPNLPTKSDLWTELRNSFSLEFSNKNDSDIQKFEKKYSQYPKYFENLTAQAYWYLPYVLEQVELRGMPAEISLVPAIESVFKPDAVSRSNAVGMWQIISATARRFGLRQDWWVDGRRDMVQSTRAALDYFEFLFREFNGDWELALAAYNAGEGTIRKAVRRNRAAGLPTNFSSLRLKKETAEYVPKLFAIRNIITDPKKFGINLKLIPNQNTIAVIDSRSQTDLFVAASLIPVDETQLRALNYGYKRGVTSPTGPHHIVVPAQYADKLTTALSQLSYEQRVRWARHQVKAGEYLGRIAAKHSVTVNSIIQTNKLSSTLIKPGQELKIPISTGRYQFASASVSNLKESASLYTVRSGDSLWRISRSYGITLNKLLRWNNLSKHTLLYPGQQLIVGKL